MLNGVTYLGRKVDRPATEKPSIAPPKAINMYVGLVRRALIALGNSLRVPNPSEAFTWLCFSAPGSTAGNSAKQIEQNLERVA